MDTLTRGTEKRDYKKNGHSHKRQSYAVHIVLTSCVTA